MRHIITYIQDTQAFITELLSKYPKYVITNENGSYTYVLDHTPTIRNEHGSLALTITSAEDETIIDSMVYIENLGTYEELFANPDALSKYKLVYPYDVPLTYINEDGTVVEYTRPEKMVVFA